MRQYELPAGSGEDHVGAVAFDIQVADLVDLLTVNDSTVIPVILA